MNLNMDMEALATPLQDIFDLLILLKQSIFMVNLCKTISPLPVLGELFSFHNLVKFFSSERGAKKGLKDQN